MNTQAIIDAVASTALSTGQFDRVNAHEPKAAPTSGLSCAIWAQRLGPHIEGSGLASTSARLELNVRVYMNMLTQPEDAIDPRIVRSVDALMTKFSSDIGLGGTVAYVDLLGSAGSALEAVAGYITIDQRLFRVVTISLPLIINDAWTQAV
jgi:hypothetical protein